MFTPFSNTNQFDPNAGAFINATGIGGIEAVAINNLVNQLKTEGLWSGMTAIYPMVGGTANTHKYNLINPQDTDAAYRLNFVGGWTHSSSGAKPDGISGTYANTFAAANSVFTTTNGSLSYYSFTNNAAADDVEIGATNAASAAEVLLAFRFTGDLQYAFYGAVGGSGGAPGNSFGYMIGNRTAAVEGWKNGTRVVNTGTTVSAITANTLYLGADNNGGGTYRNSSRGCSFAHIGKSLPTGGPANLTNIVNTFNKTLQRNVF
jgi:hypothetical protein